MLDDLFSDCRPCYEIWNSPAWKALDPEITDRILATELYVLCSLERPACPIERLVSSIAVDSTLLPPDPLKAVAACICAVRLTPRSRDNAQLIDLGLILARRLLRLSASTLESQFAQELWVLCGDRLFKDIRHGGNRLSYQRRTWDFVSGHARALRTQFAMSAYSNPYTPIPDSVLDEMLREFLDGMTAKDPDKTDFILSQWRHMQPMSLKGMKAPDPELVGVLRPL